MSKYPQDATKLHGAVLACTDEAVLPVSKVFDAVRELGMEGVEQFDSLIITSASSLSKLPVESSSIDFVILIWKSLDCPMDQLIQEVLRVLKAGGTTLIRKSSQSIMDSDDKTISDLGNKLLLAGFSETRALQSTVPSGGKFSGKVVKSSPKVQIDFDSDLIDENRLLTEEDLKKPQLPPGDCEIGSTRKACKNCSCGRAQEEEKVLKLGLTAEQITNPQSACGSCELGDAFRCGTCPYKGLPPFKMGEKVALPGNFLVADISWIKLQYTLSWEWYNRILVSIDYDNAGRVINRIFVSYLVTVSWEWLIVFLLVTVSSFTEKSNPPGLEV